VAAGEGDITVSPVDVLLPHFQAGRLEVLMASGSNPVPGAFPGVKNAAELGMPNDPFDQTRVLGVPSTVPQEHRGWLTQLFTEAAKNEDYQEKRRQNPGMTPITLTPEEAKALAQAGYDAALPIMKEMGVYWAEKQ
jgi:tripartite-type tricarboxylate transporter receptor subunit TctC